MKTLREIQARNLAEQRDAAFREANRAAGIANLCETIAWDDPSLSLKKLREATSESAFPQLLRAGVQNFLFDAYQQPDVVYPDLVRMVSSDKLEELYAPMYGTELPKIVPEGAPYEDSRLLGLDYRLRNQKRGRMLAITEEAIDDDQTGQIQQRAGQLGERMRLLEEQDVIAAITAASYSSTIGNVAASPTKPTAAGLKEARIRTRLIKDPLGNLILVQPDTILCAPEDTFDLQVLINSTTQPSVPGAANQNLMNVPGGTTGFATSINPLQGFAAIKESVWMSPSAPGGPTGLDSTNPAWIYMETKKSVVFQERTPLRVVMEAPNSGAGFNTSTVRYRVDRRYQPGVVESRYLFRGN